MSLVKDLVDLMDNLNTKVKDRTILEALFPIREKMILLQQEMLDKASESHETIVTLRDQNSELRAQLVQRDGKIHELNQQLAAVKSAKQQLPKLVKSGSLYYEEGRTEEGQKSAGYCPRCYEVDRRAVSIVKASAAEQRMMGYLKCPQCKNFY